MSFTYTGDPSSSAIDAVRFLVGDTQADDPLLQDSEIQFCLSEAEGAIYQAAHDAAYAIAAIFVRKADQNKSVGDLSLSLSYGNRAEEFRKLGDQILEIAERREPPMPRVADGALKSVATKIITEPSTEFWTGITDNRRGSGIPGVTTSR